MIALCLAAALRIFVSVDMEGIAGVVTGDQLSSSGFEYERFRGLMTEEANAAIAAARAAGAAEIVVADSHGSMQNLLVEKLPADVQVVRGSPRPLGMMQGIEGGHFDGAIFIGYHAVDHQRRRRARALLLQREPRRRAAERRLDDRGRVERRAGRPLRRAGDRGQRRRGGGGAR